MNTLDECQIKKIPLAIPLIIMTSFLHFTDSASFNVTVEDAGVTFNVTLYNLKNMTINLDTDELLVPYVLSIPMDCVALSHLDGAQLNTTLTGTFEGGNDSATFVVEGLDVAIGEIRLTLYKNYAQLEKDEGGEVNRIPILVKPPSPRFGIPVIIIMFSALAVNIFGFSLTLEVEHVASFIKMPYELAIIFMGKFVLMPLLALMYTSIFQPAYHMRYILIVMMAAPSGAMTNVSTLLLKGRINLNVLSLILLPIPAIVLTPFWAKFIGDWMLSIEFTRHNLEIPWIKFFMLIIFLSVPGYLAILINRFFPKQAFIVSVVVRPIAIVVVAICLCLTIYDSWWTLRYALDYRISLPPVLTVVTGVVVSVAVAGLLTRSRETTSTIMLQTVIPNPGYAMIFFMATVPQPYGATTMSVIAVYYALVINLLLVYLIFKVIREERGGQGHRKKKLMKMAAFLRVLCSSDGGEFDKSGGAYIKSEIEDGEKRKASFSNAEIEKKDISFSYPNAGHDGDIRQVSYTSNAIKTGEPNIFDAKKKKVPTATLR